MYLHGERQGERYGNYLLLELIEILAIFQALANLLC